MKYLNQVKNARSRFDYMVFQNGIKLVFKQISEFQSFVYTFCGEFECGTYPNTEVGFLPSEVNITLEGASDSANTVYTNAGTTPDISVGAQFNEVQVGLEGESGTGSTVYTETGTIPDPSVGFSGAESGVSAAGESTGYDLYYNTDADKYAAEE